VRHSTLMRQWLIPVTLGIAMALPQIALADSYVGNDWLVTLSGTVTAPGLNYTAPVGESDVATAISQTSATDIVIPLNLADLGLSVNASGTVTGTHITAVTFLPGPISVVLSGMNLKLYNLTAHLEGDATGINSLDTTGDFGSRVYEITGDPTDGETGTSFVTVGSVKWGFLSMGSASVSIDSWSAHRDPGVVPEPGTLVLLLGMAACLSGYGWWKRRGSR
jgi:hypothetical protein